MSDDIRSEIDDEGRPHRTLVEKPASKVKLIVPTDEELDEVERRLNPKGSQAFKDNDVDVTMIEKDDSGWRWRLAMAIIYPNMLYIFFFIFAFIVFGNTGPKAMATAITLTGAVVILTFERLYKKVKEQTVVVCLNLLSPRKFAVFPQGLHPSYVWDRQSYEIDLQKGELVSDCRKFTTKSGVPIKITWQLLWRFVEKKEYLSRSLRFTKDELKERIKARVNERISLVVGKNDHETINAAQDELDTYVSMLFGGPKSETEFELYHGIHIDNPAIESVEFPEDAADLIQAKSVTLAIAEATKRLIAEGVDPNKAALIARGAVTGEPVNVSEERKQVAYEGLDKLPQGLQYLGLGDDNTGALLGGGGGKKQKKEGGK